MAPSVAERTGLKIMTDDMASSAGRLRGMYENWLLSIQFKWTPILTFSRRRLKLLDWFESNTEPAAFVDTPERVGVALIAPDLRVSVTRHGIVVESGTSELDVGKLSPAIEGVFEVMDPRAVLATRYFATGATPLTDADYFEECSAFGRMVGGSAVGDAFRVIDGSALVDLQSETMQVQVEWGIVSGDELFARVTDPGMSRIDGREDDHGQSALARHTGVHRDLPDVAIFTDQRGSWRTGGQASDVSNVLKLVSEAKQTATTVATGFAELFRQAAKEAR